jgi:hypothetical protein
VAERPDGDFHFELGEKVVVRVGYDAERLATVSAEAVDSFAGLGFFVDRAWFEPREALSKLSSRRSDTVAVSEGANTSGLAFRPRQPNQAKGHQHLSPTRTQTHLGDVS